MYNNRMRCPETNKVVYETKKDAEDFKFKLINEKKHSQKAVSSSRFRAYQCPHCDWWHLGHSSRKE